MARHVEQLVEHNHRSSKTRRISVVTVPAALMTLALFAAMQNLVEVEYFSAPDPYVYDLPVFMEQETAEIAREPTRKPIRRDPIDPPPLPVSISNTVHDITLPSHGYSGAAPAEYGGPDLRDITTRHVTAVIDRTMQPITRPIPIYPDRAAQLGLSGTCDVHLSLTPQGEPFNVKAECTDRVFNRAAEKAVSKVKFAPKIRDGLPVTVTGVVYPIEFQMEP